MPWPVTVSTSHGPALLTLAGIPTMEEWRHCPGLCCPQPICALSLSHPRHQGCCWGGCCSLSSSNMACIQRLVAFYSGIETLKHRRRALGVYINNLLYIKSPKRNLSQSTESHCLRGPMPFVCKSNTLQAICNLQGKKSIQRGTAYYYCFARLRNSFWFKL